MTKILVSSALALSFFCFLESTSAKAQDVSFFPNAYSRPAIEVEGLDVGTRGTDLFAPTAVAVAPAVAAQRHRIAHVTH